MINNVNHKVETKRDYWKRLTGDLSSICHRTNVNRNLTGKKVIQPEP